MKVTAIDSGLDRKIVIAMITSERYLREVRDMYSPEFFTSSYARTVATWCIDYYAAHQKAPGKHIADIFSAAEAHKKIKDDQVELIRTFLKSISNEFDAEVDAGINVEYLLDETIKWFKRRDLEHLSLELEETLRTAGPEEAEELLRQRKVIERTTAEGYDPINDEDAVNCVFENSTEPLFKFPGAFGQLVNNSMVRDSLIGILAPEKSGKTFLLTEITKRAYLGKCNVALFELGDMSKSQINRRFYANLCGLPSQQRFMKETLVPMNDCLNCQLGSCPNMSGPKSTPIKMAGSIGLPIAPPDYLPCTIGHKCKEFVPAITRCIVNYDKLMAPSDVARVQESLRTRLPDRKIRFHVASNDTTSAEMINDTLTSWKEKLAFIPDVIVVDYDLTMAREKGCRDDREAFNAQWKWFRRISQDWHCAFFVASQTDSEGLDTENIKLSNFSGDKRKYSHCTGMLGIHGLRSELGMGLARISWMLGREEDKSINDQVIMGRHLSICRPLAWSMWRYKDYKPKELTGQPT